MESEKKEYNNNVNTIEDFIKLRQCKINESEIQDLKCNYNTIGKLITLIDIKPPINKNKLNLTKKIQNNSNKNYQRPINGNKELLRNIKHVSKNKIDEKSTTLNNLLSQNTNKESKENIIIEIKPELLRGMNNAFKINKRSLEKI